MHRILLFVASFLTLAAARPAFGWNYTGHRMIATIAYDELKPEVRAKVDAILRAHPRYEKDLLGEIPQGYDRPERFAFAMSASWPDIIRSQSNPMHLTPHRPMWHFINVPFTLPNSPPAAPATVPASDAPAATQPASAQGPRDVVEAIAKNRDDLRNPNLPDAQKAVAICWLGHLVGDLHQPLHATTLFSAQFPDGDRGGNRFIVHRQRRNQNLHAIWDEMLGEQTSPMMIDYLAAAARNDPKFKRDAMPEVSAGDPDVWKMESHVLGKEFAYQNGALAGASEADIQRDPTITVPALPDGYIRDAEPIALRRAALAGLRLADLLNAALSD